MYFTTGTVGGYMGPDSAKHFNLLLQLNFYVFPVYSSLYYSFPHKISKTILHDLHALVECMAHWKADIT